MRTYFIPICILVLFFISSVFLTVRQDLLFSQADQALVSIGYKEPGNKENTSFFISHQATTPRVVTVEYRLPDQSTTTETITLQPQEKRILTPPESATISVRYLDTLNQEQILNLYKK